MVKTPLEDSIKKVSFPSQGSIVLKITFLRPSPNCLFITFCAGKLLSVATAIDTDKQ